MIKVTKQDKKLIKLMRTLVNIAKRDGYFTSNKNEMKELQGYEKFISVVELLTKGGK